MSEDINSLPANWALASLPLLVFFQEGPGLRRRQFRKKGIPFLNIRTFKKENVDKSLCQYLDEKEVRSKYSHFLLQEGDIIVSSSGTLGRTAIIKKQDLPLMLNTSVIRFRPLNVDILDHGYLHLFLKSSYFYAQIEQFKTGTAQLNYGPSHLKRMQIILPPPNEQRRIVCKAKNLFSRFVRTKEELAKIPSLLKKFRQSVLAKAFNGELTEDWRAKQKDLEPASVLLECIREARKKKLGRKYKEPEPVDTSDLPELPEEWEWGSLESIGEIVTGNTPSTSKSKYYGSYLPFIKPGDLDKGKDVTTAETFLSKEGSKVARIIPPGSIMVTSIGATIGKTGISAAECTTNQQINSIVPFKEINPYYLYYYCLSPFFFNLMLTNSSSTTLPIINKGRFSILPVPIASPKEQLKIVTKIEQLYNQAYAIEKSVKIAQTQCEKLSQSILAKAFRGDLVEQDPKDKPADMFLEKITKKK